MAEIKSYPELVDAVWTFVQGTSEKYERAGSMLSEEQIAERLEIPLIWNSDAYVGIEQAINDLVNQGYSKEQPSFIGQRWRWISPSINCPDVPPSALFLAKPIPKLLPIRTKALQFIHAQTVRHSVGITFYSQKTWWMHHEEFVLALLPSTKETDMFSAKGTVMKAVNDLKETGFLEGSIKNGALSLWVTLKGACWLLIAQPLLKLEERASRLTKNPETLDATRLLTNTYSESQHNVSGSLYIAIEKLENATGGESGLINLLGQPATYVKDLKHSLQPNRHAEPWGQTKLTNRQCLERATEIVEKYITLREQGCN